LASSESAAEILDRGRAKRRRRRPTPGSVVKHAVLLAFSAMALLPIYFMVVSSLKTADEYFGNQLGVPHTLVLSTLQDALSGGQLYRWLANSALITASSVLISTGIAALAAYPISLMRWRPGQLLLSGLVGLMVVPPIALIIPLFQTMVKVNQQNTYQSVIVIYVGLLLPFSTYLLASFFATIPRSLIDAARIDGASRFRILRRIVLPLSRPALVTVIVVQALFVWNEVLIALVFLQRDTLRTLMVGLTVFKSRYHLDVPLVMAGMLWATVPMVLLYLAGQRFFIRGLTAGATKG
jgi:ABC-type glycerol-3-phosphate transport system permease component